MVQAISFISESFDRHKPTLNAIEISHANLYENDTDVTIR